MIKLSFWKIAFIFVLIVNLIGFSFIYYNNYQNRSIKYAELKKSYIKLVESNNFLLEILLENPELKYQIPAYENLSIKEFHEAIRRKIISLNIEVKNLEKE